MRYVLIVRTITGTYVNTLKFATKREALAALVDRTACGYLVTMMKYSIYLDCPGKWERKEYALIREDEF